MYTSTVIHLTFYTTNSQKDYAEITLTPRVSKKDVKMSDTGFEPFLDAMAETPILRSTYTDSCVVAAFESQMVADPELPRLIKLWPLLCHKDRLALLEHAVQLVGSSGNGELSAVAPAHHGVLDTDIP